MCRDRRLKFRIIVSILVLDRTFESRVYGFNVRKFSKSIAVNCCAMNFASKSKIDEVFWIDFCEDELVEPEVAEPPEDAEE